METTFDVQKLQRSIDDILSNFQRHYDANQLIIDLRTVLFSTHVIPWVEAVCERVIVISEGRIAADGAIADLTHGVVGGLEAVFRELTQAPVADSETPPPEAPPDEEEEEREAAGKPDEEDAAEPSDEDAADEEVAS